MRGLLFAKRSTPPRGRPSRVYQRVDSDDDALPALSGDPVEEVQTLKLVHPPRARAQGAPVESGVHPQVRLIVEVTQIVRPGWAF